MSHKSNLHQAQRTANPQQYTCHVWQEDWINFLREIWWIDADSLLLSRLRARLLSCRQLKYDRDLCISYRKGTKCKKAKLVSLGDGTKEGVRFLDIIKSYLLNETDIHEQSQCTFVLSSKREQAVNFVTLHIP